MKKVFAWIHKYETHLSAGGMVAGFIVDNIFFVRVDLLQTQALLIGYLVIAAISIAWWQYLEDRSAEGARRPKWHSSLPIVTQFMLGGLWSAFLIFYSRSATLATSWPFLLVLGGIFLGNEVFKKYHSRLVFNAVLYFFALYSYAIFTMPLLTHSIGTGTFLLAGVAAIALFALFMLALRHFGRFRFLASIWSIRFWAGVLFIVINLFYFTNILPPLPLALKDGGIYHSVTKTDLTYIGGAETEPWYTALGISPTLHVASGESLTAYSAVFAPVALTTKIVHRWMWYDVQSKKWVTKLLVSFPIAGGRDGGYRGYTTETSPVPGQWRVDIETSDGHIVGRLNFSVVSVPTPVVKTPRVLN